MDQDSVVGAAEKTIIPPLPQSQPTQQTESDGSANNFNNLASNMNVSEMPDPTTVLVPTTDTATVPVPATDTTTVPVPATDTTVPAIFGDIETVGDTNGSNNVHCKGGVFTEQQNTNVQQQIGEDQSLMDVSVSETPQDFSVINESYSSNAPIQSCSEHTSSTDAIEDVSNCEHMDESIVEQQLPDVDTSNYQQGAHSFIGPQIPEQTTPVYKPDVHSFIGPQIPEETTSVYQQPASQPFIGPQIPDNYTKSQEQHQVIPQEPLDSKYLFSSSNPIRCVDEASSIFMKNGQENYLRGCKWSPDGTQILTNSNDNILRTFVPTSQNLKDNAHVSKTELIPNCVVRESGIVYDFSWFPGMDESKPETCRLACSCPGSPMHLWDSQDGRLVSSYRAFDHCDEVTSAYSLSFSPDGSQLFGGYKNSIRIFDTEYSHRKCTFVKTLNSKTKEGHTGIISCFTHGPPGSNVFVTGSYSRHVGIYYSLTNELVCLIQGQQGGVTHVMISPDGQRLYTGGRKDPEIVCWDMRNTGQVLCTFLRDVQTNQRIYFDLSWSGRYLVSGNHDGSVQVWDTCGAVQEVAGEIIMKPCHAFQAHGDCTNGVSFNQHQSKLATSSGQRHFKDFDKDLDSDDSDEDGNASKLEDCRDPREFSLKIWNIPCIS